MIYLREVSIRFDNVQAEQRRRFPYSLAERKIAPILPLTSAVTFFVGENGSGKSTILEAIATVVNGPTVGATPVHDDPSLQSVRSLGNQMRLAWARRTQRGFFMRTEDFFNFSRKMAHLVEELAREADGYADTLNGYGLQLARSSALAQRQALIERYGEDLDANSHGEAMMQLLMRRVVPGGLYLLDEPETPFSPQRQLALLSLMKEMSEEENCQFIVATHSPILLALPDATIYSFDHSPARVVAYDDLEHVNLTRDFLNNPQLFLRHL